MINPVTPLSLYTFDLELILFIGIFSFRFDRRKFFPLRLLFGLAFLVGYTFLWSLGDGTLAVDIPCYMLDFLLAILLTFFCFDIPFLSSLFLATAGYAAQHFSYKAIQILLLWMESSLPTLSDNAALVNAIYFLFYLFFLPLFYLLFGRRVKARDDSLMNNRRAISIGFVVLLGATTLNLVFESNIDPFGQIPLFLVCSFFDLIVSFLSLLVLFDLFQQGKIKREYQERRKLWNQEKKQLEVSKENFEYLSILAHDLKHIVEDIGATSQSERVKELNKRLMEFGTALKTGNEPLDLILAERKAKMDQNHIAITVMADGKALGFMRPTDCYTLFMNLVDNAVEALLKIPEERARSISLSVRKDMGLVFVHEENPYQGQVLFRNNRPVTDKKDELPHGLGVSSMCRIVESYGGEIDFRALQGVFSVDIVLDPSKKVADVHID